LSRLVVDVVRLVRLLVVLAVMLVVLVRLVPVLLLAQVLLAVTMSGRLRCITELKVTDDDGHYR
jgi:hypothetical protein